MSPRRKYNNRKSEAAAEIYPELAGRRFDSKLERDRATELVLLQRAGEIRRLEFQVTFRLTKAEIAYKCDMVYDERIRPRVFRKVAEEVKGVETPRWRMIRKLWHYYGPCKLRITKRGRSGRIMITEEIIPQ